MKGNYNLYTKTLPNSYLQQQFDGQKIVVVPQHSAGSTFILRLIPASSECSKIDIVYLEQKLDRFSFST